MRTPTGITASSLLKQKGSYSVLYLYALVYCTRQYALIVQIFPAVVHHTQIVLITDLYVINIIVEEYVANVMAQVRFPDDAPVSRSTKLSLRT